VQDRQPVPELEGREWLRAAVLFGIAATTSVFQPAVLVGVPFLLLVAHKGMRGMAMSVAVGLAMLVAISGIRDGYWYVERAWTVILGSWFLAFTLARPTWRFSTRALGSVLSSGASVAVLLSVRSGAWSALDWTVSDRVKSGIATFIDAAAVVRGGEAISPALATAMYEMAEAQLEVFPALIGIASMAALGVAWWLASRLNREGPGALGPLRDFRFNDHFVWIFIGGVLLLVTRWGEPLHRVGSNAVAFMGALYALRGAAVVVFMSGGFSWIGYVIGAMVLALMAPVVLGAAMVIGLGDTWFNVRDRARELAA
jgi:predicted membrane protein DUF2232